LLAPAVRMVLMNSALERMAGDIMDEPGDVMSGNATYSESTRLLAQRMVDPDAYIRGVEKIESDAEGQCVDEFEVSETGQSFVRFSGPIRDDSGELIGRILSVRKVTSERAADRLKSELLATV